MDVVIHSLWLIDKPSSRQTKINSFHIYTGIKYTALSFSSQNSLRPGAVAIFSLGFREVSFTHLWVFHLRTLWSSAAAFKTTSSILTVKIAGIIPFSFHFLCYGLKSDIQKYYLIHNLSVGIYSIINSYTVNLYFKSIGKYNKVL
jgi:hypothetical protein